MIFQSANEMVQNNNIREKLAEIQAKGKKDKEWWDQERASIQSQFMKELDEDTAAAEAVKAIAAGKTGSDEDAVLVEGGGPANSGSSAGKGARKRKGKS